MAARTRKPGPRANARSDPAASYDQFKEFEGQRYTGMKVGRSHKWHYDPGVWKATKVTPDLWQISYAVTKRRAGRAPEGSGVPVGTEYHWYVAAHQHVARQTANDYTTSLAGVKFKVAHKRADSGKWSATPATQRKRLIQFLQGVIAELEKQRDAESTPGAPAPSPDATPAATRRTARVARPAAKRPARRRSATRRAPVRRRQRPQAR